MENKEQLYESFAELIFSVAMADGVIDDEEINYLHTLFNGHPVEQKILSLHQNHNSETEISLVQSYKNTLNYCKQHGHDPEYEFLISNLEKFTKVSKPSDDDDMNEIIIDGLRTHLLK